MAHEYHLQIFLLLHIMMPITCFLVANSPKVLNTNSMSIASYIMLAAVIETDCQMPWQSRDK